MYKVQYEKRRQQKRKWQRRFKSLRNEVFELEDLKKHYSNMTFSDPITEHRTLQAIKSIQTNLHMASIGYEWMIENLTGE